MTFNYDDEKSLFKLNGYSEKRDKKQTGDNNEERFFSALDFEDACDIANEWCEYFGIQLWSVSLVSMDFIERINDASPD